MALAELIPNEQHSARQTVRLQVFLAFFAIYILWGSTYLAIRIVVETVPPLFAAGVRFITAGFVLYLWSRLRHAPPPSRREWRNLAALGALMFLAAYSALFWAEKTMPSGIASVLVSTIPVWTALFEIFVFKKEKLRGPLVIAIVTGLGGVSILASVQGRAQIGLLPILAVLGAEISWSFGTVLSKNMQLPSSKQVSASGQMMTGGAMLLLASALAGELHPFPHVSGKAAAALLYLIVAGSLVAFTAYVWLLGRMPATKVASYAYVNPVVALAFGYWFGGEALTIRTLLGSALVLASVFLLLAKSNPSTARVRRSA